VREYRRREQPPFFAGFVTRQSRPQEERSLSQTARAQQIESLLREKLSARHVDVLDQSALHEGHPGAQAGGGHYHVLVVAEVFEGLSRIAAQRVVYQALADLMESEIHALSMHTMTPQQWADAD
jgi:BolA protein